MAQSVEVATSGTPFQLVESDGESGSRLAWWSDEVSSPLLDRPNWVTFDLQTLLADALAHSPRIQGVSKRTSIALEKIVQQDAAFDPNVLLETRAGRTNDPVGNSLTTGGPPRLNEESFTARAGITQAGRRGTELDLSQELGLLDSNSLFFQPNNQGNARLNLSLTQPLLGRGGQVYNERLLMQARIDSRTSWQAMRGEVEQQLADVVSAYWMLYELRCHLVQAKGLFEQARAIESILTARRHFDCGEIELAKARGRVAKRSDRVLQLMADIQKQQVRLARAVGAEELVAGGAQLEMIPRAVTDFPTLEIDLAQAVIQGFENRAEVRAAALAMESAALSIQVTRTELMPELVAVMNGYLAGLNGDSAAFRSFGDQFSTGGPGFSAGLRYELPYARRAARSRHREANHRYRQRSEELREAIQLTHAEIAIALVNLNTAIAQQETKRNVLITATQEETILTARWEMMAGDGGNVGTVLESLLDSQQRRADAESDWSSTKSQYLTTLVELQRAMGTLLRYEQIDVVQQTCDNVIEFVHNSNAPFADAPPQPSLDTEPPVINASLGMSIGDMIDEQESQR
ncbi:TolC family protein [Rubripirellula tenax]|uniref:TolC family protein n=1 Tax=Rubripirellula tenax TaxID=2528015 RepID=UPI001646C8A9|nr:TolC family protein [Rubripirellula tenax]